MVKINKKSFKNYFSVAWIELVIISAVLFVDLLSKFLVSETMRLYEKKVVFKNFFSFFYTLNTEAAMGFDFWLGDKLGMDGLRIFFIALVSISTLVFGIFLVRGYKGSIWYRVPLALIIGGALGNLYDRIVYHAVRDFIHIEYFGKTLFGYTYFPTFNLADSALVIGVIMFVFYVIFIDPKYQKRQAALRAEAEALANEAAQNFDNLSEEDCGGADNGNLKDGAQSYGSSQFSAEKYGKSNVETNMTSAHKNETGNTDSTNANKTSIIVSNSADGSLIESAARAVDVLDGQRKYSKKVVTETIITETIVTETKGATKKDNRQGDK